MPWLGLDIGGANIKLADGRGYAASHPFALWQRPDDLARELQLLIERAPTCDQLAVTMTGELADCFRTKIEGVGHILDAVERAAAGKPVRIYTTNGVFATVAVARAHVSDVAAANWHAVARFAARFAPVGSGLLVDIGSTTCDVIPLRGGCPCSAGRNDTARLLHGELVYSGVARTPVFGIVSHIPWRGVPCPVARETFASARDVYLLTGDLPEAPGSTDTADGRPATKEAAHARLARIVCADATELTRADAVAIAATIAAAHACQIAEGIRQVVSRQGSPPETAIVSGEGEFLARAALRLAAPTANVVSLQGRLGANVSRCAPSHAVAVLAAEEQPS